MEQAIGGQRPPLNKTAALWRTLSATGNKGDAIFRILLLAAAVLLLAIVGVMIVALASESMLSIRQFGFSFLTGRIWNPIKGNFGSLTFVYGTIVSSLIALLISVPLSLGIAVFLVERHPTMWPGRSVFWWDY